MDSLSPVSAQYTLTYEEFSEAFRERMRKTLVKAIITQTVFTALIFMLGDWYLNGLLLRSAWSLVFLGLLVVGFIRIWYTIRRQMRDLYERPFIAEHTRATFSKQGVEFHTLSIETRIRWGGFSHFVSNPKLIKLSRGPVLNYIIPARGFESEQDFRRAVAWCAHNIANANDSGRGFEVAMPVKPDDFTSQARSS